VNWPTIGVWRTLPQTYKHSSEVSFICDILGENLTIFIYCPKLEKIVLINILQEKIEGV